VRLKLDENVDPRAIVILRTAGHDVATVPDEHLSGCPDTALEAACRMEARCLVTLDLDFANVLAYPPEEYPGLVVLRHPKPTAAGLLNLVRQLTALLEHQSPEHRLWIVEPGRLRVHEPTLEAET
jgi:predicted nuclease of predicted toxin-antitoxin system